MDPARRTVLVDGTERHLTARETHLLTHLALHSDRIVPRSELLGSVWRDEGLRSDTRTVDVHVRRIREKLGVAAIRTARGIGYGIASDVAIEVREPLAS
ncbi:hypothetical protein GCM10025865_17710 [Paraoerskovia sediminicola]|uniref:OmpR/PhoB-type domain-containing protein n=1 Tax=Paraoerskovia sediminicola TaxID=1138587 RepID=A0ABM8G2V3_9CELL|nr:winged helix-turn-helix domain-containing protein [Paraoerskovia sediminicola]BDZ42472.1 hypothetical protein GCM10025865_17710 [Paraoerskovia sediminicola]